MEKGYVEPVYHEHGEFLEYTWVEPERIEFLKDVLDMLGDRWLGTETEKKSNGADYEDYYADLILRLDPCFKRAIELTDDSHEPVVVSMNETLDEAGPYIREPALRKKRQLGDLHLDLIHLVNDMMVVALRLLRSDASPVMPFQRWVGSCEHMDIWLRTLTKQPDILHFGPRTRKGLRFHAYRLAYIMPNEIDCIIKEDVSLHSLALDRYLEEVASHNAYQETIADVVLFQHIPRGEAEWAQALRTLEEEQEVYRSVLSEVWKDLRWMRDEGYAYAGWARRYDYE